MLPPLPGPLSTGFATGRRPARIAAIVVDEQDWSIAAFGEALARCWPSGAIRPEIHTPEPADLDSAATIAEYDVVLILGGNNPRGGAPAVLRLADLIEESLTPAVYLATVQDERLAMLASDCFIVLPPTTPPTTLACVLHTLATRQPTVRRLQTELRAAHFVHGGASAEIDKLQEELLLAGHIQREFLPKVFPDLPSVAFEVLYRPASFVSGDVYDIVRLDEHHAGFVLADAMGHGVAAALLTLFITAQMSFKRAGPDGPQLIPPAEALANLNLALCGSRGGPARMASAICGIIDSRDGTIRLAAAGHPHPILVSRSDGAVRPVEVSGMLLGVDERCEYEHSTVQLARGDVLLLHTDGLTTPTQPGEPEQEIPPEILEAFVEGRPLPEAVAQMAERLDRLAGSLHQPDDVTVIALGRTESAAASQGRRRAA